MRPEGARHHVHHTAATEGLADCVETAATKLGTNAERQADSGENLSGEEGQSDGEETAAVGEAPASGEEEAAGEEMATVGGTE